jgi:hypothetical protein
MRQAIVTQYMGPTNTRGSRIKAAAAAGSITIPYSYDRNSEGCHAQAAEALVRKYGWSGVWVAGGMPSERGNVYVCIGGMEFGAEHQSAGRDPVLGIEGEDWFGVRREA